VWAWQAKKAYETNIECKRQTAYLQYKQAEHFYETVELYKKTSRN